MYKTGYLSLWLFVNLFFGFLQLIVDYSFKYHAGKFFDVAPLIMGGSILFFCSGFTVSSAFDIWVLGKTNNVLLFMFLHIIVPLILLISIVTVYLSTNFISEIIDEKHKVLQIQILTNSNLSIFVCTIIYGIISKLQQLNHPNNINND